jgi:hypothetical protein
MKKLLWWFGGCVIVLLIGFGVWFYFFRPESAHVLNAKRQAYGKEIFSVSRCLYICDEVWEFRERGIIYILQGQQTSSFYSNKVNFVQYTEITSGEVQQIEELVRVIPSAKYYGCPERKPAGPDANGIAEAFCAGSNSLRLTLNGCSIYNSCNDFTDLNDSVSTTVGSTIGNLLKSKGVLTFTEKVRWVSLEDESDLYFYLTSYAPIGFAVGLVILIAGIISKFLNNRSLRKRQGESAQLNTRGYHIVITIGYFISSFCILVYLFEAIWHPTVLRIVQ